MTGDINMKRIKGQEAKVIGRIISREKAPDVRFERQIITGIIISDEFCKAIIPLLKSHPKILKLSIWYGHTIKGIIDYWDKYGKKAPVKYVGDIFRKIKDTLPEDTAKMTEEFLTGLSSNYVSKREEFNSQYEIQRTIEYLQKQLIENNAKETLKAIRADNIDGAQKLLSDFKPISININNDKQGFTAKELFIMDLPEIQWTVDGVISPGLTLFAGKPKVGKSFFMLNAAIDIALGRNAFASIPVNQGEVLYLALEDTVTTLKDRLHKILGDDIDKCPDKLFCYPMSSWPKADQGGLQQLEKWMEDHPDTGLIIIDTFEKFKKRKASPGYDYSMEYQSLIPLQEFAGKHGISVIVVHHTRKTKADSVFDEIGGTTGLTGAADALLVMQRLSNPSDRVLAFRGRHIGEGETAFRFENFRFILTDEVNKHELSKSRQIIIEFFEEAGREVQRKEIVDAVGDKVGKGIDVLLQKLVESGNIERPEYGKYALKGYKSNKASQKIREKMNKGKI